MNSCSQCLTFDTFVHVDAVESELMGFIPGIGAGSHDVDA